jgi:hypothetical protein
VELARMGVRFDEFDVHGDYPFWVRSEASVR